MPKPEHMEGYKRKLRWQSIAVLAFMFVLFAGAGFQRFMLWNDGDKYPPPGYILEDPVPFDFDYGENEYASGTSIHVLTAGERTGTQPAILLLGGWREASPVLDYGPLSAILREHARVIIPELPGRGWSGGTYSGRTLDNMLADIRGTLHHLGETGPCLIVAHTTAGLEAVHFANEYPGEVSGIVFLDAPAPAAYSYRLGGIQDYIKGYSYQVPKHTGIFRVISLFAPELFAPDNPEVNTAAYAAMYCKNVMSPAMLAERRNLSENAKTAYMGGIPAVPVKSFVDTKSYNANPELNRVWSEFNNAIGAEVIAADGAASLHITNPKMLADEILKMMS